MSRKAEIIAIAREHKNALDRTRRIYLEEPSFAIGGKKTIEYEIKSKISGHFNVPFRSVVFCGSAHLGFSPHKDTEFIPGSSDLDVAIINMECFQGVWMELNETTRALTDVSGFSSFSNPTVLIEEIMIMLLKRGMIHLSKMPRSSKFNRDRSFLDDLSKEHRHMFARITVAFYMNEYAFCWKQNSAIRHIVR